MSSLGSRRTELVVILDGRQIFGLLHASIVTTNCFSSDSYSLTFAMGPQPLGNLIFWSSLSSAYIEISATTGPEGVSQDLISGMIDTITIDPIRGTVAIEGRDLSSFLIDSYRQQDFVNQTASEVLEVIALYHGLTPVVTATSTSVGRYYGDGHTRLSLGQFSRLGSDWDLVVQLARENTFDVFVQGNKLFFQPATSAQEVPLRITLPEVKIIRFERNIATASKTKARVQSWNSQHMTSYASDGTDDRAGLSQEPAATPGQLYLFSASNFSSEQVTGSAARYATELSRLSTVLHIEMPWDLSLSPRRLLLMDQTGSQLDASYRIDNMERHYSTTSGSSQIIRAVVM